MSATQTTSTREELQQDEAQGRLVPVNKQKVSGPRIKHGSTAAAMADIAEDFESTEQTSEDAGLYGAGAGGKKSHRRGTARAPRRTADAEIAAAGAYTVKSRVATGGSSARPNPRDPPPSRDVQAAEEAVLVPAPPQMGEGQLQASGGLDESLQQGRRADFRDMRDPVDESARQPAMDVTPEDVAAGESRQRSRRVSPAIEQRDVSDPSRSDPRLNEGLAAVGAAMQHAALQPQRTLKEKVQAFREAPVDPRCSVRLGEEEVRVLSKWEVRKQEAQRREIMGSLLRPPDDRVPIEYYHERNQALVDVLTPVLEGQGISPPLGLCRHQPVEVIAQYVDVVGPEWFEHNWGITDQLLRVELNTTWDRYLKEIADARGDPRIATQDTHMSVLDDDYLVQSPYGHDARVEKVTEFRNKLRSEVRARGWDAGAIEGVAIDELVLEYGERLGREWFYRHWELDDHIVRRDTNATWNELMAIARHAKPIAALGQDDGGLDPSRRAVASRAWSDRQPSSTTTSRSQGVSPRARALSPTARPAPGRVAPPPLTVTFPKGSIGAPVHRRPAGGDGTTQGDGRAARDCTPPL